MIVLYLYHVPIISLLSMDHEGETYSEPAWSWEGLFQSVYVQKNIRRTSGKDQEDIINNSRMSLYPSWKEFRRRRIVFFVLSNAKNLAYMNVLAPKKNFVSFVPPLWARHAGLCGQKKSVAKGDLFVPKRDIIFPAICLQDHRLDINFTTSFGKTISKISPYESRNAHLKPITS